MNTAILANIVRILVSKLKNENKDDWIRYRKTIKAAVFLLQLLGGTYLIFLISPEKNTLGEQIFLYVNTFFQSFQVTVRCKMLF